MSLQRDFQSVAPYEVCAPAQQRIPFVFNSPHSGRYYPPEFLNSSRLNSHDIRQSEDCYVDELFATAVLLGAPLLHANFPRAYLDVNREPYELDPKMFLEPVPAFTNIRSARVAGGLGTVAKIVGEGQDIYKTKLPLAEALGRIESLYKPYHNQLGQLLSDTKTQFGYAVLIDCHSMPSGLYTTQGNACNSALARPDFIIGDRFGRSCTDALSWAAIELLQNLGYNVAHNKPYAGGYITEHYGRPHRDYHALQIEVNRALYVDEGSLIRLQSFTALCHDLARFMADLTALPDYVFMQNRHAAE
ncbi:N-formylglutamate amidohydrolase [Pseudochrobactrum sp. MP213Fo]|uniref:N-formylglutamate amidohydrolase n=1 Tax=Pseudochrobactrum sp. MP213Fo TaxID=3022250 RepID=UPI003B9F95F0